MSVYFHKGILFISFKSDTFVSVNSSDIPGNVSFTYVTKDQINSDQRGYYF
jgi:hypothetical protein